MNVDTYKKIWEMADELARKEAKELECEDKGWIDIRRMQHIQGMTGEKN